MDLSHLSDVQREAVLATEGPILVLAGAGSGKTNVLTHRVAYLVQEKGVDPSSILAITFTNKAAGEMRERIEKLIDANVNDMTISTFHSMCARFLRYDACKIGYTNNFSIYDSDDCKTLIKKILKDLDADDKLLTPSRCLSLISGAKNASGKELPKSYIFDACDGHGETAYEVYLKYCERMEDENAMDFDDLLLNMLKVLKESKETRDYYVRKFKYVLVDEYQDTNSIQYELVHILSEGTGNLFVVGDDDQSIYAWRGADIRNILEFEKDYPDARVFKLEQNYRSHANILNAANAVISKASQRHAKQLWSARKEGDKPVFYVADNEYREAEYIAMTIENMVRKGKRYADMAILYRMHTQSRALEEKLRMYGIPYEIFGGISFYERKEIRDMMAYLTVLDNPAAGTALMRIINVPKRGIGEASMAKITAYAENRGIFALDALERAGEYLTGSAAAKCEALAELISEIKKACAEKPLGEQLETVYRHSGYRDMLMLVEGTEGETRRENVDEFINAAYAFEKENEGATLTDFLASVSLISDVDTMTEEGGVSLMTMHSAKGLEFDTVFLAGMEENIFPSYRTIMEGKVDEERRLCYVGITRAKNHLFLTGCKTRNMYAQTSCNPVSRFVEDIPENMLSNLSPKKEKKADARIAFAPEKEKKDFFAFKPQAELKPQAKTDASRFKVGMKVNHAKFGSGKILSITGEGKQVIAVVAFPGGERKMFLAFAPLTIE